MSSTTGNNKIGNERNQKMLLELVMLAGNDSCADCKARTPRWASWNLGAFLCVSCASIHRKIGTHVSKVKSLTMDTWTREQVEFMRENGNIKVNIYYNPNEARHPPPSNFIDSERDSELEKYIRAKYEFRRFIDRAAIVASKLGPSRSASGSSVPALAPSNSTSDLTSTSANLSKPTTTVPVTQVQQTPLRSATMNVPPSSTQHAPSRSVSHPIPAHSQPAASMQQQQQQQQPQGVWADLVGLQTTSVNSTLPLQFQAPSMGTHFFSQPTGSAAPSLATYQQVPQLQQSNSFSQFGPSASQHFTAGFTGSNFGGFAPNGMNTQYMSNQPMIQSPHASSAQQTYFQPQPQQFAPNMGLSATPTGLPTSQSPSMFLSPSPSIGPNRTSPFLSTTPQLGHPGAFQQYPMQMQPTGVASNSFISQMMPQSQQQHPQFGMQQQQQQQQHAFGNMGMMPTGMGTGMNMNMGQQQWGTM